MQFKENLYLIKIGMFPILIKIKFDKLKISVFYFYNFSLMLLIMPALGHINIPMDSEKRNSFLNLQDHPQVTKQLLNFMLDMLLLPYG